MEVRLYINTRNKPWLYPVFVVISIKTFIEADTAPLAHFLYFELCNIIWALERASYADLTSRFSAKIPLWLNQNKFVDMAFSFGWKQSVIDQRDKRAMRRMRQRANELSYAIKKEFLHSIKRAVLILFWFYPAWLICAWIASNCLAVSFRYFCSRLYVVYSPPSRDPHQKTCKP